MATDLRRVTNNEPFVPLSEPNSCERFFGYCRDLIWENEQLCVAWDDATTDPDRELAFFSELTRSQQILLVVGDFDAQVCNGGIAQFMFNKGHMAEHVTAIFDFLGQFVLRDGLDAVLRREAMDPDVLAHARIVAQEEGENSSGGSISDRAHQHYTRARLLIEDIAETVEEGYFPTFPQDAAGNDSPMQEGTLQVQLCEAVNRYVEAHPDDVQRNAEARR